MGDYSIFQETWWWDACAPGQWEEVNILRGRHTEAGLRFLRSSGPLGMVRLSQPRMVRWAGPWVRDTEAKTSSRLTREKKIITELIEALPRYDHFMQSLHPQADYWLPYRWAGFDLEPQVTYRLTPPVDGEALWLGFDERIRRAIRKARKSLQVVEECLPDRLIDASRATYTRQNQRLPIAPDRIEELIEAATRRGVGRVLSAVDDAGQTHASLFLAWDAARMYYVLGGGDPGLRVSGAASLLLLRGLEMAGAMSLEFDFAGSGVESIERFFRGFGARPVTYIRVSSTSRRFRAARALRRALMRTGDS